MDPQVRDTWEVPGSRVKIDKRRWDRTLLPTLGDLRAKLDLPSACKLTAELQSMLVYAPGQFFLPHQDSEKADAMVGSLVVTLPSAFTGGALVVAQGARTATYRSSKKSLSFVAFYADCRHEVKPVKSGYRIVLTYNLILTGTAATPAEAPEAIPILARCLDEHFTTPVTRGHYPVEPGPPSRLVYLLDHEYTQSGLSWARLKGSDARRSALLKAAAIQADCEVVLALADVHETWSCYEQDWHPRYRRYRSQWDDHEPDDPEDHQLDELVDWGVTLSSWIGLTGAQPEPIVTSVHDHEVCSTTPSVELAPYAAEYEGNMGNYGNTMDRWYHRGAVAIWPRQRAFAVRAEASPPWALDALLACLREKGTGEAQELVATMAPFWKAAASHEQPRGFFTKALRVANLIDQPELAATLLTPFGLEMLTRGHAGVLVKLYRRYGAGWVENQVRTLSAQWRGAWPVRARSTWVSSLPRLCEPLGRSGAEGTHVASLLTADSWRWLDDAIKERLKVETPSLRLEELGELGEPTGAMLEAAAMIGDSELRDAVVGALCQESNDLLACSMQVLRSASPAGRAVGGLDTIAAHCTASLEARLARPPRSAEDWSVAVPPGCECKLCEVLGGFLVDPTRRSFDWPLAEQSRRHVHRAIDIAELPVYHQTRRKGRPYTLVLIKTDSIFELARAARARDEADIAWLLSDWPGVSSQSTSAS